MRVSGRQGEKAGHSAPSPADPGPRRLSRGEPWDLQVSGPPIHHAGADAAPPGQHPESRACSLQRGPGDLESRIEGQRRGRKFPVQDECLRTRVPAGDRRPSAGPHGMFREVSGVSWVHSIGSLVAAVSGSDTRTTWAGS